MKEAVNKATQGFLSTYRVGKPNEVRFIPLRIGFLRLEYGLGEDPEQLSLVSFVINETKSTPAIGPRLEFNLESGTEKGDVTFIKEDGISGLQWSEGRVFWGYTYDDDSPPAEGRKVRLGDWVDECISKMINPRDDEA